MVAHVPHEVIESIIIVLVLRYKHVESCNFEEYVLKWLILRLSARSLLWHTTASCTDSISVMVTTESSGVSHNLAERR